MSKVAHTLNARGGAGRMDYESETFVSHSLKAEGFDASEDGTGRGTPIVAFSCKDSGADVGEVSPTLRSMNNQGGNANAGGQVAVQTQMAVRRLTPEECEKLQGFLPGYTLITYHGKPAKDGPRYRALGNSMATTVMSWLGKRIQMVDEIIKAGK